MKKIFPATFVIFGVALLFPNLTLAKPIDGYFASDAKSDDVFDVRNGKLINLFSRTPNPQPKDLFREYVEITPYILKSKADGTYYCSLSLNAPSGRSVDEEYRIRNLQYPWSGLECTAKGWKLYNRPRPR